MDQKEVTVLNKEEILHHAIFRWWQISFKFRRFNGSETGEIKHYVLDRGDSVGMLLHHLSSDEIVLVEQLRIAALESKSPWLFEIPAGRVDPGEDPNSSAKREIREETGGRTTEVQLIGSFYLSPGGCSERLHLFYCPFPQEMNLAATGGLAVENEDIKVHRISLRQALKMIRTGEIVDAKTVIALLWLNQQEKN